VVLLLVIALAIVVLLDVFVLVGGRVELLPLGVVSDEVGGIAALEAAPTWSPPLLAELVQGSELPRQLGNLVVGMLSYCSLEVVAKEDKANSKVDEIVVLVGLASWPPTGALVIKDLLVREASWLGWPFLDSLWDLRLLNSFSVSSVAKSADSTKVVIFIPQIESSRAYSNYLARSLSEYARGPQ
jgi:hypothetical protein